MKRVLLLALVLVVLGAGTAQARTTLLVPAEASHPYQRWVDAAYVPTPTVSLTVSEDVSICEGQACTDRTSTIYMLVTHEWDRFLFLHELGHVWDNYVMRPVQRARFVRLIEKEGARPGIPWDTSEAPGMYSGAEEWFADTYAICALRNRVGKNLYGVNVGDGVLTGRSLRWACGMIRHTPV